MTNRRFKLLLLGATFFILPQISKAQSDLEVVLEDLLIYIDGYITPAAEASVTQAGAAWYFKAAPNKKFQVSFGVYANALVAPDSKQFFNISDRQFQNLRLRDGEESARIPTAVGPAQRTFLAFDIEGEDYQLQVFEGISSEVLGHPFLQMQVGLWQETEISLRYAPKIRFDQSNFSIYGVGVTHNISQYLFKNDRPFEFAVMANYSLFDFNLYWNDFAIESNDGQVLTVVDGSLIDSHAFNFQLLGSKSYGNWTFSSGVGFTQSWIDYKLTGQSGQFLTLFNSVLRGISDTKQSYRLDAGAAYQLNKWSLIGQLSINHYANMSLGAVYMIN